MLDLARSSSIHHQASGVKLQTPLLIPSLSSKGFARKPDGKSEVHDIAVTAAEFITDVVLVSAYDIHYNHIQHPDSLPIRAELTFVDSGGYEISTDKDYSCVIDPVVKPESWSPERLRAVYDEWPSDLPAVFVSYDNHDERKYLSDQIGDANNLFAEYPDALSLILIKPGPGRKTLQEEIKELCVDASVLRGFDIIGVTEKELGSSLLTRMTKIAQLRTALDNAGIHSPLHIFGALDPISIRLYFLAGAEIFDGLTWLRYGYHDACCLYLHDLGALEYGIHEHENLIKTRAMSGNYYSLERLRQDLLAFAATGKTDKFAPHEKLVSNAWDSLRASLKGGS